MTLNIDEAEARLSQLVDALAPGEEIFLERNGKAVAKLTRIEESKKARVPGSAKGQFVVPDDFNDPLPKEIEDSFYE